MNAPYQSTSFKDLFSSQYTTQFQTMMAGQSATKLTIYEQRLLLLQRHRQEWRNLSDLLVISCHELHERHRQERLRLVNPTRQEYQTLLRQQVDLLWEQHQANQALRDQLRANQNQERAALNIPLSKRQE